MGTWPSIKTVYTLNLTRHYSSCSMSIAFYLTRDPVFLRKKKKNIYMPQDRYLLLPNPALFSKDILKRRRGTFFSNASMHQASISPPASLQLYYDATYCIKLVQ